MKRNIAIGIFLFSAIALSSCSINQLASNNKITDNVYNSDAKAGDASVYANQQAYIPTDDDGYSDDDNDYFYYDDYASRINRFSYASPFGYYDNFYGGYYNSPFYNAFTIGYGYGGYGGWGLGLGYGLGYGYGGYGYGGYYGGWGLGLGYGLGYGYGGYGYGGYYGYNGYYGYGGGGGNGYGFSGVARPSRGINTPYATNRAANASGIGYIPGGRNRINNPTNSSSTATGPHRTTTTNSGTFSNNNGSSRPARTDVAPARPVMQQPTSDRSSQSQPVSTSGGVGSSRGTSSSSGGGGARPSRP